MVSAQLNSLIATASFNCILKQVTPAGGFAEHAQQFDGPFASWIDVKTGFGAKGDGSTDDTEALQRALDSLATQPAVLWIPKGTYVITQPLHLRAAQQFSIIGEDPRNTVIEWHGPSGGTMMNLDGCTWFRLARFSWDGLDTAAVALSVASTLKDGENYPTFDAIEDQKISRVGIGLRVGFAGETSVQRVHFDRNTRAGISLEDWDALNFNVIDSLFTDCNVGVTNVSGAGAFNVSNSVFVRSQTADMMMGNTGPFSERQNISFGSQAFFVAVGAGAGSNVILQANTIINPVSNPIRIANPGPIMLIDNNFKGLDPSMHILVADGFNPLGIFSIGNAFAVTTPFAGNLGNVTSIDEATALSDSPVVMNIPSEVYIPDPSRRAIFEIPTNSTSSMIQQIVNEAAATEGGAVVHFPSGRFPISQTIELPDSPNLTLVGDGPISSLEGTRFLAGPIVHVIGTRVHLEDMQVTSASGASVDAGLDIVVKDLPSTAIHCNQCKTEGSKTAIEVNGLDNASVDFRVGLLNASGLGAYIRGGAARLAGYQTLGRLDAFMTSVDAYDVGGGGHFLVEDGWHDAGQGPVQFDLTESGVVTHQGGTIYTQSASSMTAKQFAGEISLLGVSTDSTFVIDSASNARAMLAGTVQVTGNKLVDSQGDAAVITQLSNYGVVNNGTPTPFTDEPSSPSWVEHMFAQARTEYVVPRLALSTTSTNITLHRMLVIGANVGIRLHPKQVAQTVYSYAISSPTGGGQNLDIANPACSNGNISLSGKWSLQGNQDGSYGLNRNSSFLSNSTTAFGGAKAIGLSQTMSDAGQRWIVKPIGNGFFEIVNRASGDALTREPDGCAKLYPESGANTQEWAVNLL